MRAELTAAERTGLHKYTFPESDDAWFIVDLDHSYLTNGVSSVYSAELRQIELDTITGGHVTRASGNGRHCYFTLQVSKQPASGVFYSDDKPASTTGKLEGDCLKAILHFKTHAGEVIYVRTGISGVSAEGAAKNLRAEQPDWDFEKTRAAAQQSWRQQLSRIQADFAAPEKKRIFYTALYHMSLGPQLFDDVDGRYRGMDWQIHQLAKGKHEGEPSLGLCDRLDRIRDNSQRQLPTDNDYAVPTREYQTDQSSLKPAPAAARSVFRGKMETTKTIPPISHR